MSGHIKDEIAQLARRSSGGVDAQGIGGCHQRRDRPLSILSIPGFDLVDQVGDASTDPMLHQLFMAPPGALLGRCGEKDLERRIRKNHRPHIPAVGNQSRGATIGPLPRQQRHTDLGVPCDARGGSPRRLGAHLGGDFPAIEQDPLPSPGVPSKCTIQSVSNAGQRFSDRIRMIEELSLSGK